MMGLVIAFFLGAATFGVIELFVRQLDRKFDGLESNDFYDGDWQ